MSEASIYSLFSQNYFINTLLRIGIHEKVFYNNKKRVNIGGVFMAAGILKETKQQMSKAIDAYRNQSTSITVSEARMLLLSPYDKSSLT